MDPSGGSASRGWRQALAAFSREVAAALLPLLKVMIPVAIVVRLLQDWGLVEGLSVVLEPVMGLVGLPAEMGLVWATAMATSLYGGIAAYGELAAQHPLSVAQVTVLFVMMLTAHGLPVESAIARQAGLRLRWTVTLRVGAALVFGWLHHVSYTAAGALQQTAAIPLLERAPDPGWGVWLFDLARQLALIALVIVILLLGLRLLRILRIEALIAWLLRPLLRLVGIQREAVPMTLVGTLLGLSYGGGLLIKEARAGHVDRRQVLLAMSLLCLCHSQLEDTLMMIALGGHWSGVALGRTVISLALVAVLAWTLQRWPQRCEAALMRPLAQVPEPTGEAMAVTD